MAAPASSALAALFGSETKARILSALVADAGHAYHLSGLAAAAGVDPSNAQKTLRSLLDTGLVVRDDDSRGSRYRANPDSPLVPTLRELFLKSSELVSDLEKVASALPAEQVHIFGSVAKGTDKPGSDVDILVIGDISAIDAQAAFKPVGRKHRRKVDVFVLDRSDLARTAKERSPFLAGIVGGKYITLKGGGLDAAISEATSGRRGRV
jgi:DNA-binding transcriptional ArsR family regulator